MNISRQHLGLGVLVMCATICIFFISFITTDKDDWNTLFNYFQTLLLILTFAATLIIALANIDMSEAAQTSATAAENAVGMQQEAFTRLERPYFYAQNNNFYVSFKEYVFNFELVNHGKLPGVLRKYKVLFYLPDEHEIYQQMASFEQEVFIVVPPGEKSDSLSASTKEITQETLNEVSLEECKLRIEVLISYQDDMGNKHSDAFVFERKSIRLKVFSVKEFQRIK